MCHERGARYYVLLVSGNFCFRPPESLIDRKRCLRSCGFCSRHRSQNASLIEETRASSLSSMTRFDDSENVSAQRARIQVVSFLVSP